MDDDTDKEIKREIEHIAAYQEYEYRENRRQWWRDLWEKVRSIFPRRKQAQWVSDDDIPF